MKTYDYIVLGGGIMGASTAFALSKVSDNVLLIDQYAPGHTKGSSHGDGRILRYNYSESIYVEMATHAYSAWNNLQQRSGSQLIKSTGLIQFGSTDCKELAAIEVLLRDQAITYEILSSQSCERRFPQLRLPDEARVLYQPDGAVAFATRVVQTLWKLCEEQGATLLTNQRVHSIETANNQVELQVGTEEVVTGSKLIVTVGAWTTDITESLGLSLPLKPTREWIAYFAPINSISHQVGEMPCVIDSCDAQVTFYSLPQIEVPGVKVGWHQSGDEVHPDDAVRQNVHVLSRIQEWVEQILPHLSSKPSEIQSCLYTNTPDDNFILDVHPDYANIIIGAGFSGHGFKFGPLIGQVLADLALEKAPVIPLKKFAINRF